MKGGGEGRGKIQVCSIFLQPLYVYILPVLSVAIMAGQEMGDFDAGYDDNEEEVDIEIDRLEDKASETTSQQGIEETDGRTKKKKKKAANRIVQDGEHEVVLSSLKIFFTLDIK